MSRSTMGKLVVVSRIHVMYSTSSTQPLPHTAPSSSSGPRPSLAHFVQSCLRYAEAVVICLGAPSLEGLQQMQSRYSDLLAVHLSKEQLQRLHLLPVYPWGHFTSALNTAVLFVADLQADIVMFQSAECVCEPTVVSTLVSHLSEDTMMVGLALPGHDFHHPEVGQTSAEVELTGRTCPWNTCAVWSVDKLSLSGFPLVGDGFRQDRKAGGVEEVSAIAFLQTIHPHFKAKLVLCGEQTNIWETNFSDDPTRQSYHEEKMRSKEERPRRQLEAWGTLASQGRVMHIHDV